MRVTIIHSLQQQMGILSARARPNRRSNTKWWHFVRQSALNGISNLEADSLKTLSKKIERKFTCFPTVLSLRALEYLIVAFVDKILAIKV